MSAIKSTTAEKIFSRPGSDSIPVRVKPVSDKFASKRAIGRHSRTGQTILDGKGQEVQTPSEYDAAVLGTLVKSLAAKQGNNIALEAHEADLLNELCVKATWHGDMNNEFFSSIEDGGSGRIKAILDDATSGGISIAPIGVDDMIIQYPLLHSEVWPFTNRVTINRGRRIEGSSISNVTVNDGGGDNVEIPLFNTANLVNPFNTDIHVADFAIEIGLDLISDSVINVGQTVQGLIGSKMAQWLDEKTCIGNGTSAPEGLFTASGVTTITTDNGGSGPPTLADYLDLHFGLGKQYRKAEFEPSFLSSDTTYARSRGIRVDAASPSTDQRVLFGMNLQAYQTFEWPHRVCNVIPDASAMFVCLRKYRSYVRAGLTLQVDTSGSYLRRHNLMLVTARMRMGGQLEDADAAVKWVAGQS